jgi:hypothetical protein
MLQFLPIRARNNIVPAFALMKLERDHPLSIIGFAILLLVSHRGLILFLESIQ